MTTYVELHCHSNFSFHDGASSIEELLLQARELGYPALALTDHDNLCGAMRFAQMAPSWGVLPIVGAEVTIEGGYHLTLLAENAQGYHNLCRMLSYAYVSNPRDEPRLAPALLVEHAQGLIALSGCARGEVPSLLVAGRWDEARAAARRYREWFGDDFYLELQQNLCYGDRERIRRLAALGRELGIPAVATNNVHYHVRERHQLQDVLVAIKHCKTLEETHRERRPNSEFYLKSHQEMAALFAELPEAIANTIRIAESCTFDLTRDLEYQFPDSPVPPGHTPDTYLEHLCYEGARRRYGEVTPKCRARLQEELHLIRKHKLSGFFLIYHEILKVAREVAIELGVCDPKRRLEEDPPGRSRGSSVSLLVGYLIGLSH
ncbi:MAG TPA: PHP domain-containing protein, partial [Dehalococcoidia bacterium]|nr:PHP domain-containing protein [Dehalococcoidia bacterium]